MNTHSKTCLPVLHQLQRNIWRPRNSTCTQFLNTSHAPGQIVIFQERRDEASSLALWHILRTLAAASMERNANTLLRMTLQTQRRDVEIRHPLHSGCRFPCPNCTMYAKFPHPSCTVDAKLHVQHCSTRAVECNLWASYHNTDTTLHHHLSPLPLLRFGCRSYMSLDVHHERRSSTACEQTQ